MYHYRVKSRDAAGNLATSPDFTFTTATGSGRAGAPGTPTATPAKGTGQVAVSWTAPTGLNVLLTRYTLQHKDVNDSVYSNVASGLSAKSYTFSSSSPEQQGTWTYRVIASDGSATTSPSADSNPVIVDRTLPNAPSFSPNRAPDYTGDGNWWRGSVTMTVVDNGDPNLPDSSGGSGIDSASTTAPFTITRSGPTVVDGWVKDFAGNWRKASMTVQVDATPPQVWWNTKCGQTYKVGQSVLANWGASDANVGLNGPNSGNIYYDTSSKGSKSVSVTMGDRVGNTTTISCAYKVG